MDLHIRNTRIIAPGHPLNGQQRDLLLREGIIMDIGESLSSPEGTEVLEQEGLQLSIGWMDTGVFTGDPGLEQRETLHTAGAAAAAGGFTAVATQPNTLPAVDSKSGVLYVRRNAEGKLVNFYPMGAVTLECAGKEITEMIDMQRAGAVAFTDGKRPVQHAGIMLRALQYVKAFGGLIVNHPMDTDIGGKGQVHEGLVSTSLGMPGIPALAEEMMVRRDLHLLEYTESRLHLANLSTKGAVQAVREARARGLQVTASVAVMNLIEEDSAAGQFDSNYKVMPPLRSAEDRKALCEGVLDGTIDIICSNHRPLEEEQKKLEFTYAGFGATGLETLYALCRTHLSDWLSEDMLINCIAYNPRRILGIPLPELEVGSPAELTLFHPDEEWAYARDRVYSRSCNSPYIGQTLRGRPVAVINNNQSFVNAHS